MNKARKIEIARRFAEKHPECFAELLSKGTISDIPSELWRPSAWIMFGRIAQDWARENGVLYSETDKLRDPQKLAAGKYPAWTSSEAESMALQAAYISGHAEALAAEKSRLVEVIEEGRDDHSQGFYVQIRFNHRHRSSDHNSGWNDVRNAISSQWGLTTGGHINATTESPLWYQYKGEDIDYDCTMLAGIKYGVVAAFFRQNGLDALLKVSGLERIAQRYGLENLRLEYRVSPIWAQ